MARIRTIKPDFFLHEGVAALSPLHRLLFIGLWTLADKRGVLEDRPRRIKAALFPWDDCDVDAMLWDLAEAGLVRRFSGPDSHGEDADAIVIPGFSRNQKPHPKETANDLPEPWDVVSREKKRQAQPAQSSIPSTTAGKGREGDLGRERKGREQEAAPPRSADGVSAMGAANVPSLARTAIGVVDGGGETLQEGIQRIWLKKRGTPWVWRSSHEIEIRHAFDMAGGDQKELLRVFAQALDRTYPKLTKLADLGRHWNDYAASRQPQAKTGRASGADTDWSDVEADAPVFGAEEAG